MAFSVGKRHFLAMITNLFGLHRLSELQWRQFFTWLCQYALPMCQFANMRVEFAGKSISLTAYISNFQWMSWNSGAQFNLGSSEMLKPGW